MCPYVPEETFWLESFDRVARTGASVRLENYHHPTKHRYAAFVVRVGVEGSNRVAIVFDDITEQREFEEKLRASEDQFHTLTDAVPQIIWTNNSDGTADYFNSR